MRTRIGRPFEVNLAQTAKDRYHLVWAVKGESAAELSQLVSHTCVKQPLHPATKPLTLC
jgi:hypothetical protein